MAEYSRETNRIESLTGSNYQSWKYNIKLVLMDRGLWGYVSGDEIAPIATEEDKKEKEIKEYRLKCEKAYSVIALNILKNLQIHISSTTSPKTAWETLEKQFQFVSITEIVHLNRAFYAATMEEGSDLMAHLTKMTTLAERLRELKEDISSKKFATAVLGSLPESYDIFLSSLNARNADDMDWDGIRPLLVEEFMKRKRKEDEKRNEEALFVKRNFQGPSNPKGFSNFHGPSDNFQGSSHSDFRKQNFPEGRWQNGGRGGKRGGGGYDHFQAKGRMLCYKCDEPGHKARFCPKNKGKVTFKEEGYYVSSAVDEENGSRRDTKRRRISQDDGDFLENAVALTSSNDCNESSTEDEWYIDSAASSHMTHNKNNIIEYEDYNESSKQGTNVFLGDNTLIPAEGEGKVQLLTSDGDSGENCLALDKVLHVPQLAKNLLSVPALTQTGAKVLFDKEKCLVIKDDEVHTIGRVKDGKLYKVNSPAICNEFANVSKEEHLPHLTRELWHCRLGHLNHKYVNDLDKKNLVNGLNLPFADENKTNDCEACILGKMQRVSCPKDSQNRAANCFEIIHTDLCGPMQVDSVGGSRYLLSFTDDYSRYVTVYFLKRKSEVLQKFKEYVNLIKNRTGSQIRKLNTYLEL